MSISGVTLISRIGVIIEFPLFNHQVILFGNGERDFFVLVNSNAVSGHILGFNYIAINVIQRVRYSSINICRCFGRVRLALCKDSLNRMAFFQCVKGVNTVRLCLGLVVQLFAIDNPVVEVPAAVCACLQLNLAAAGNLGQVVHSFAAYGCNDFAMLHVRSGNRKISTVGLERNLSVLGDREGIAAICIEFCLVNSLAVHLIGFAVCSNVASLGRYRNLCIAGDTITILERLGERFGGIIRINHLITCGQFAVQRQRVAVALEYGNQFDILCANLNGERVGAVIILSACRIVICTEFLANPLLEVPAGIRRCGEDILCTAGNISREVFKGFVASLIGAFERTACIIGYGSVQCSTGSFEVHLCESRLCTSLDGNGVLTAAVRNFFTIVNPVINRITCIRRSGQGNIGVCGKAGNYTAVIRLIGIQTCGNDRRRTDRVLVCAFTEIDGLQGQHISRAVYRVNTGDKGEFVVVVQRFVCFVSLTRRNCVVAGCDARYERFFLACGVYCTKVKFQLVNLIIRHVVRVRRERKLGLILRIDLILCNAVLRGNNTQRNGTRNNGKLGLSDRIGFTGYISIQRVSADIQLRRKCLRFILRADNHILEGCVNRFQLARVLGHAGERRRYLVTIGEAGDAVAVLAVGERQLVAGCVANEDHLAFRAAHILEYIAARIIRSNRVSAVCGHDNIGGGYAVLANLGANRGGEVRAANQEAERAGWDGGGSRRGTHRSTDMQRAVVLRSTANLNILRRNIQLTLGCALAVLRGNLGRVSGNAVLVLGVLQTKVNS